MKIAVPTNDGTSISPHFGRSAAFLIFEVENGTIKSRETRTNGTEHSHAQGECASHEAEAGQHSHQGIIAAIDGCQTVICGGMGHRAAEALKAWGITDIVVTVPGLAEDAVSKFLNGTLARMPENFCRCSH
jgi:predicted Fe-Mo cluster-binding NifX family protein